MDSGTRRWLLAGIAAVIVLGVAAATFLGGSPSGASPGQTGTSAVTGVIVGVDAAGLGDVSGFTLRGDDGAVIVFSLDRLQNGSEFPPGHLAEHQATAEPVLVRYVVRDGVYLALRVDDAPRPT